MISKSQRKSCFPWILVVFLTRKKIRELQGVYLSILSYCTLKTLRNSVEFQLQSNLKAFTHFESRVWIKTWAFATVRLMRPETANSTRPKIALMAPCDHNDGWTPYARYPVSWPRHSDASSAMICLRLLRMKWSRKTGRSPKLYFAENNFQGFSSSRNLSELWKGKTRIFFRGYLSLGEVCSKSLFRSFTRREKKWGPDFLFSG